MTFDRESLKRCCGSTAWVRNMIERMPFADEDDLLKAAGEVWWALEHQDWLQAFAAHPKIGDRSNSKWSSEEQSGMNTAGAQTALDMKTLNEEYERKFGYIFIVCATGKTADEMQHLLIERLKNDPEDEIRISAREQAEITKLRLRKLLA